MPRVTGLESVSRETLDRLEVYVALLKKWTRSINLVAPSTLDDIWSRHIADSAQLLALKPVAATTWADLGSGGGLPGVVIAILAAESAPELKVTCVESDQRKAVFLRTVSRETGVSYKVISERIEGLPPLQSDVISARALAPLGKLLELSALHCTTEGCALLLKGAQHHKERADAEKNWRFKCEVITSCTDPNAVIYKIGALRRA